jgi:hypothetical protein
MTSMLAPTQGGDTSTVPVVGTAGAARTDTTSQQDAAQKMRAHLVAGLRNKALSQMLIGASLIIVGVVITAVTYHSAVNNPNGGTYMVMWGPVVVGALAIFRGARSLIRTARMR